MKVDKQTYDLLVRSLEEQLSAAEARQLEEALTQSETLRLEQQKLIQMRSLMETFQVSENPVFSQQIMNQLQQPTARIINLKTYGIAIAAACVVLVMASILGIYAWEGSLSTDALLGIQDLSPEDAYTLLNY